MEQLEQLKTMRDQAVQRLEAARAAIEISPDAKLVNSLGSLITELEGALGVAPEAADSDESAVESVEGAAIEPIVEEEPEVAAAPESEPEAEEKTTEEDELSLEESLEAELMGDEAAAS